VAEVSVYVRAGFRGRGVGGALAAREIHGFAGLDAHAEELAGDLEEPLHHTVEREVGAQHFVVEIVVLLAALLGPVGDFPWFERSGFATGFLRLEFLKFAAILLLTAESLLVSTAAWRGYPLPLHDYRGLDAPEEPGE
jgi:hypothetical protein